MQPLNSPPPIPTPDGHTHAVPISTTRGDWQTAPKIVKGWAFPLTWLAMLGFVMLTLFVVLADTAQGAEKIGLALFYAVFFVGSIWLNRALKKGTQAAWTVQMIWSILGLLGFPLGTAIHGYILSQWFKPETKAWFGQR